LLQNNLERGENVSSHSKRLLVPQAKDGIDEMKYEIANGVDHQGRCLADVAGSIGGEITKQLVTLGEMQLKNQRPKK
jgi:hypothetical protein